MRWLFIVFIIGCAEVKSDLNSDCLDASHVEEADILPDSCLEEWLCYSPGTRLHNRPCTEECMSSGDTTKFCFFNSCE